MAYEPIGFWDRRNPLFGGSNIKPMGYDPAKAPAGGIYRPTPAAVAAQGPYNPFPPGYDPTGMRQRGPRTSGSTGTWDAAAPAPSGAQFGLGAFTPNLGMNPLPGGPLDPQAMQIAQMRNPSVSTVPPTPRAPRPPSAGGGAPAAPAPAAPAAPAGTTPPMPAPTPEGQVGPTLTAPPPKTPTPADAMAAGDPDKQDFQDMQRAIAEWQMGMGGTGLQLDEANRLDERASDLGAGARVKGDSVVANLTRAMGGAGEGYFAGKAKEDRARVKETVDQLRNQARAQLEEVRARRRKKPEAGGGSAQDRAFAQSGDVSARLEDEDGFVIG